MPEKDIKLHFNEGIDLNYRPKSIKSQADLVQIARYWIAQYAGIDAATSGRTEFTKEEEAILSEIIQDGLAAEQQHAASGKTEVVPKLAERIADGNKAQDALMETNLRFARLVARETYGLQHKNVLKKFQQNGDAHRQAHPEVPGQAPRRYGNGKRGSMGTYRPFRSSKSPYASLPDRYSNAALGVLKESSADNKNAMEKFVPQTQDSRARFIQYAQWAVHKSIDRSAEFEEHNGIRLTSGEHAKLNQYFGDNPTAIEGVEMPQDIARLVRLTDYQEFPDDESFSYVEGGIEDLNDPFGEDDHAQSFADIYADDQQDVEATVDSHLLKKPIEDLLDLLSEREAGIIRLRFGIGDGEPRTLAEIAQIFELTVERIRQIEAKTMAKLRHPSRSNVLRDHLEATEGTYMPTDHVRTGDVVKIPSGGVTYFGEQPFGQEISNVPPVFTEFQMRVRKEKQSWQVNADEPWDLGERSPKPEESGADPELFKFIYETINSVDSYHFQKSFAIKAGTPYPMELSNRIEALCGNKLLNHGQIASIWERFMSHGYQRMKQELGDDFDTNRVGMFFSYLIARNLRSVEANDTPLTLRIPGSESGKIGYLASGISYGHIRIIGNPGDYAARGNRGFASVEVVGTVGYGAGLGMKGNSLLTIDGHAGRDLGLGASEDAWIIAKSCDSIGWTENNEPHVDARELEQNEET